MALRFQPVTSTVLPLPSAVLPLPSTLLPLTSTLLPAAQLRHQHLLLALSGVRHAPPGHTPVRPLLQVIRAGFGRNSDAGQGVSRGVIRAGFGRDLDAGQAVSRG
eukprot:2226512-Pyramimonas_sp.AAC.1